MKSFVIFNVLPAAIMAMAVPDYAYYGSSTYAPSTIRVCRKKTSYSVGSTTYPGTTVTTITTTSGSITETITSTITSSTTTDTSTTTTATDTTTTTIDTSTTATDTTTTATDTTTTTTDTSTTTTDTTTTTTTDTTTDPGTTTDVPTTTTTTTDLPPTTTTTTTTGTCPITFVNPRCNRDWCLRAIIACSHGPGPTVGLNDCISYASAAQQTVVAGDPVTVTSTETDIITIPGPGTATVTITPTITVGPSPTDPLVCYADNCVRAFLRFDSSASEFCATFTQTVNTDATLPSFALNCPTAPAALALSSGCSCLSAINATPTAFNAAFNAPVATVTPAPSLKRQVAAPTVPDYASACGGTARYESACACLGITASSTVTVAPATVTVVTTTTLTAIV